MMNLIRWAERWLGERGSGHEVASAAPDGHRLSRAEFHRLATMSPEQIARMEEMARINGLDRDRLDRSRTVRLATALTCSRCREQGRCRDALGGGATRAATDFCPNAETYRMLASAC